MIHFSLGRLTFRVKSYFDPPTIIVYDSSTRRRAVYKEKTDTFVDDASKRFNGRRLNDTEDDGNCDEITVD